MPKQFDLQNNQIWDSNTWEGSHFQGVIYAPSQGAGSRRPPNFWTSCMRAYTRPIRNNNQLLHDDQTEESFYRVDGELSNSHYHVLFQFLIAACDN